MGIDWIGNVTGRPKCKTCNRNNCMSKGYKADGTRKWGNICSGCRERRRRANGLPSKNKGKKKSYRERYLKPYCEVCPFIPVDLRQLHLDHIDGNRANNHWSNFQTLCANCHILKGIRNGDHLTSSRRKSPWAWDNHAQQYRYQAVEETDDEYSKQIKLFH